MPYIDYTFPPTVGTKGEGARWEPREGWGGPGGGLEHSGWAGETDAEKTGSSLHNSAERKTPLPTHAKREAATCGLTTQVRKVLAP